MNYIWAFDLSLSNTGICIFNEREEPVCVTSVSTSSKMETKDRLKIIGDFVLNLRKRYPTNLIVLEAGFTRFNLSTQILFRVHGLINYLFANCEQIYFPSSTIKKIIAGNGKADKRQIREIISRKYPELVMNNDDESDAVSIGECFFARRKHEGV